MGCSERRDYDLTFEHVDIRHLQDIWEEIAFCQEGLCLRKDIKTADCIDWEVSQFIIYPVSALWQALARPVKAVKSEAPPGLLPALHSFTDLALYSLFHLVPDSYAPTLHLVIINNFE